MENSLTPRQTDVINFIEEYQLEYGGSPTLKEIRKHLSVNSDNSVLKHLKALVKKGYIEKDDTPRGIKLLDSVRKKLQAATISVPVLGFIPAGGPVAMEEYVDDTISFDLNELKHPQDCFCLRVTGDSMINVGIFEGDLVLADAKLVPKTGDIVVALVDGGNTVKTYVKGKDATYLRAENPAYEDIYPEEQLQVQGVVIKLIRDYF
ncbi:repressor LexA [Candidatus Peregrinibacteria bacterium CG11_big_fil_rev_8_21_14_0_20_41_10]|nr:MAG: repressor LexA [Candidatus Peregrinibacteria bacterium CG11_big_fil_rev_8_21_14_0_20_41_10]PIZ76836.1 MAG: repressor LexA [Candidatus Peregrinibacteria bacterium CG_4_10_14_0_2_um_filter_41_8]PJC38105.1 MAG: repressor LexA [Candidatus Peregrinibacteria bacterium CG_4_9_14_0_2_um_filter_41_14]